MLSDPIVDHIEFLTSTFGDFQAWALLNSGIFKSLINFVGKQRDNIYFSTTCWTIGFPRITLREIFKWNLKQSFAWICKLWIIFLRLITNHPLALEPVDLHELSSLFCWNVSIFQWLTSFPDDYKKQRNSAGNGLNIQPPDVWPNCIDRWQRQALCVEQCSTHCIFGFKVISSIRH